MTNVSKKEGEKVFFHKQLFVIDKKPAVIKFSYRNPIQISFGSQKI